MPRARMPIQQIRPSFVGGQWWLFARCRLPILLAAVLLGACPGEEPASEDAGPPNTCGNGELEPYEDCELHLPHASGSTCRNEPPCGNGVLDATEVCDEGDLVSGDGCSSRCHSNETCGNDVLDPGEQCDGGEGCTDGCLFGPGAELCGNGFIDPPETCDSGDATDVRCSSDCQAVDPGSVACGNGLLEAGEECDLGGITDPFRGCDETCRLQHPFFITHLAVEPAGRGCDLVGPAGDRATPDCRVDNAMGAFSALQEAIGLAFDFSIGQGGILVLLIFEPTAGTTGHASSDLTAYVLDGEDGDADLGNNDDGGALFWVLGQDLGPSGLPEEVFQGTLGDGWFALSSPRFFLNIGFHPDRIPFEFVDAQIRGTVRHDGRRMRQVEQSWLCGAMTARSLSVLQDDYYLDTFRLFLNLDDTYGSLLDIVVFGGGELSTGVLQPDVDVDGDGLETFHDEHPDDGVTQIDLCIDGDGITEYRGTDCMLHPSVQDGFSVSMSLKGIWANLLGVKP